MCNGNHHGVDDEAESAASEPQSPIRGLGSIPELSSTRQIKAPKSFIFGVGHRGIFPPEMRPLWGTLQEVFLTLPSTLLNGGTILIIWYR